MQMICSKAASCRKKHKEYCGHQEAHERSPGGTCSQSCDGSASKCVPVAPKRKPVAPRRKPVVAWVVTSVSRMWGPNCDASFSRSEGREWAKHCHEAGCTDVRGPVKVVLP